MAGSVRAAIKTTSRCIELGQGRPVYRAGFSFGVFVAGNDDGGRSGAAMGEGNARIGRGTGSGRYAGNDFKTDSRLL